MRFLHIGTWVAPRKGKTKHSGVLTIAYEHQTNGVKFGFAFCSPRDPFSRRIGNQIASGRMACYPVEISTAQRVRQASLWNAIHLLRGKGQHYDTIVPSWFDGWLSQYKEAVDKQNRWIVEKPLVPMEEVG